MKNQQKIKSAISILAAPTAGIVLTTILLLLWSKDSAHAIVSFLTGSFHSQYYFGNMLNTASIFMTAGIGAALAIKSGMLNLGGEGQIYTGGFVTAIVLNSLNFPPPIALLIAAICSAFAGAIMTLLCALLKEKKGANELLTTFLFSAAIIPIIDSGIAGKFRTNVGNLLATPFLKNNYRFTKLLPPSSFNISFFFAIILCIASAYFIYKTVYGRHLQIWGLAPEFALYSGYNEKAKTYGTLAASGAFHGVAGFFAVCGTYYTCHSGFYIGLGWNALSCALISQSNPILLMPVSIVLSWLFTSADRVALTENFGFDISSLIQGVVLLFISIQHFSVSYSRRGGK